MAYAKDLLEQSLHLARRERLRSKHASLRRAISTAYYSLFHLLVADATSIVKPALLRAQVSRAYSHDNMKSVCRSWVHGTTENLPDHQKKLVTGLLDRRFMTVANGFIRLQEARHTADYDLSYSFARLDALEFVRLAASARQDWKAIAPTNNAKVFLAALLFEKHWKPR